MDIHQGRVEVSRPIALSHHLEFMVEWRNSSHERYLILDSSLDVVVKSGGEPSFELGAAYQTDPEEAREMRRQGDEHFRYRLLLHPWQIARIEELRNGGDLRLELRSRTIAIPLDGQNKGPGIRKVKTFHHTIPRSEWVDRFLNGFGFGRYELWELHFPADPQHDAVFKERNLLESAIHDYNAGQYEDAYKDCRQAVESIRNRASELDLGEYLNQKELERTLKAAENAFSLLMHPLDNQAGRDDAELAITLARGLHRRVASALQRRDSQAVRVAP